MMKRIPLLLFALTLMGSGVAAQDSEAFLTKAKELQRAGDFNNAILVLQRALTVSPRNTTLLKELSYTQYLNKDHAGAAQTIQILLGEPGADVQAYQIAGLIYQSLDLYKECRQLYKRGIAKFPNSGVLYNAYGELLWNKKEYGTALRQWEKGIEKEPNVPGNYYHAAQYYLASPNPFRGLLYGELFINLESFTGRTLEIKPLLLKGYQQLFAAGSLVEKANALSPFTKACLDVYQSQATIVDRGITAETMAQLQTRFIEAWDRQYATPFPFRLFDHYRQLQQMGLFETYLQWIYNADQFEHWQQAHPVQSQEFSRLQQNRVFKIPAGQYYPASRKFSLQEQVNRILGKR